MLKVSRYIKNPIFYANGENSWEANGAFNGCITQKDDLFYLLYRAQSQKQKIGNFEIELSTIGIAQSPDKINFENRRQLISPEHDWEKYGCEDPRVTKIEDKYYIFYTALSSYPPDPKSIKLALAITSDLINIDEKHLITPFNAKAMALFPEKIKDKYVAILTPNTDIPPAKIALAQFDELSSLADTDFWNGWYEDLEAHSLPILRSKSDQIELGAPPIKTDAGWLLIYSYIRNYYSASRNFAIEAVLLGLEDPSKVIGRTNGPLMVPEEDYELLGNVPNVIFPTSVVINNDDLGIYYGAADTSICLATINLSALLEEIKPSEDFHLKTDEFKDTFIRNHHNPIISPVLEHVWESKFTLNPAAIYLGGKVHIIYRAQGEDNISYMGYAASSDGIHIDERLKEPIYSPRAEFEIAGCEDPRLTAIDGRVYMLYTAYDAKSPTKVALTSISTEDFLNKNWNWEMPQIISPPAEEDKDACVFEEKINGKYAVLHRLKESIWLDYLDNLDNVNNPEIRGEIILSPREGKWDGVKIGIGPPPIKTAEGWLLIYHGISPIDKKYSLGAVLLDLENPTKIIGRIDDPILQPTSQYEYKGLRAGTVFACGAVVIEDKIFVYYGGSDQYVCVAWTKLSALLEMIKK